MIYTRDKDDVFAKICCFFERINYTVVEAKVHTTQHGYALDSFLVLDQNNSSVSYRDLLSYIEYELTQKLASPKGHEAPLQGRISRQVKHMPITPNITIEPELNTGEKVIAQNHVLQITAGDRPGLLSNLAQIMLKHNIYLHTAKINTLGNRVEDTFLISARSGKRLSAELIKTLQEELIAQF